jgi:hypothetical protein
MDEADKPTQPDPAGEPEASREGASPVWNRWRGLRALVTEAVEQGTSAVERVHRATAARPFDILDRIPPVAPGARGVRLIHDATVAGVYETIRQVNRLVGQTLSAAIDAAEDLAGKAEHRQGDASADDASAGEAGDRPVEGRTIHL